MSDKALLVARALTRSGALKIGSFKLKSGAMSPYYIDLTWLLSSPDDFESIVGVVAEEIKDILSSTRVDKIASIELKGALLLPSIATRLKIPCVVLRKKSKAYGLTGRITGGEIKRGEHLIFFDDVITDGGSKLQGIKPLEEAGARVKVILVVVDREQGGRERLERFGYQLRSIITISELIRTLISSEAITREQAEKILEYIEK